MACAATALGLLASAAAALPASAVSGAPPLGCGTTVTVDTRLTKDLLDCPNDGLIIGASGITIDLGGHLIRGTNAPGGEGIVDEGHGHVVVEHGTVEGFFVNGVTLRQAPASVVHDLTVRRIGAGGVENQVSTGIWVEASPASRIYRSTVENDVVAWEADGVVVRTSPGFALYRSRLNRNSWDGLVMFMSPGSRIERNVLWANGNNGMEAKTSDAIQIRRNRANRNGNVGIAAGLMRHASIVGNVANANGGATGSETSHAGLFLFDFNDSQIRDNTAMHNSEGIGLIGDQTTSTGNHVVGNVVRSNTVIGLGIGPRANDNVVASNVASRNGLGVGMFDSLGNDLRFNTTRDNVADGVLISSPGNRLTGTRANSNGGHGINAATGTRDGGHNRAHHNRTAPQCVGVTCRG